MKKRIVLAILALAAGVCFGQAASDNSVVVGNIAQPVAWIHSSTIQTAILKAGPTGTVWIPGNYTGTDCAPISSCSPGSTLVIDLRGGTFQTVPAIGGIGSFPLLAPSGVIGAPSYSFANAAGNGMWLDANAALRMNIGGPAESSYGFGCGTIFSASFAANSCGFLFSTADAFVVQTLATNPTLVVEARAVALGGHLNQNSAAVPTGDAHDVGGTCAMSASTSCTWSLLNSFTSAPICIATAQGATAIAAACNVNAGSLTVTITAASSNSLTWGAMVIGNPN